MVLSAKKKKEQDAAQALRSQKILPPLTINPQGSAATSLGAKGVGPVIRPGFSAKPASQMQSQVGSNPRGKEVTRVEKIVIIDSDVEAEGGKMTQKINNGAQAFPSAQVCPFGVISDFDISNEMDSNSPTIPVMNQKKSCDSVTPPAPEGEQVQNPVSVHNPNNTGGVPPNSETDRVPDPGQTAIMNSIVRTMHYSIVL